MYNFVDTTEKTNSTTTFPAEALNINGTYIENVIKGYSTLYVTGRELLKSDIKEIQIGNSDGSMFQYKRNPSREITVTYRLLSSSAPSFREKFNQLCGILEQEEARLIFADEPDKYYTGTKSTVGEVQGGELNVTGTFTFYCADPYKRATTEKVFPALMKNGVLEATIINNGTKAAPIDYEITHNHENGYIGIVSEHGAIQLGSSEELDGEVRQKSQVLFDYRTPAAFGAMASGQGITWGNYPLDGSFKTVSANGKEWLAVDSIGSGSSWHGAGKKVLVPADSSGVVGATNFYVQSKVWFETGATAQTGMMEMSVGDENGSLLASIRVAKFDLGANSACAIFGIQGREMRRVQYCPTWDNVTNADKGHMYIKKTGDLFEFYFGGGKWQYRVPEARNKKAMSISIFSGQHGTVPKSMLVTRMYWDYLFFQKDNVNYWVDIPNRYRSGSKVFVDGSDGKVYVDGVISMDDEVLGSKYFLAPPGETKVQFFYSSFSNPIPTVQAKIQEVFL